MSNFVLNKTKARKALLEMTQEWIKQGKIQHAIEGYEGVIEADPESEEANQAREQLLEIARRFDQEGKKASAYHLYHKLAQGRAGSHSRF